MLAMTDVLSPWDVAALAVYALVWGGYTLLFDGPFRRRASINAKMIAIRNAWMVSLLRRENRIADATLVGHSIRSATFFASTTIILIAGLFGVLGSTAAGGADSVRLSVLVDPMSRGLFELKTGLLIAVFVYAFFKFTWAIRQFNYFSAVVGSAPLAAPETVDQDTAKRIGLILNQAVWQFNTGIRAYYYALAAIGWFIGAPIFVAMTVLMTVILIRRQLFSASRDAIADHAASLDDAPAPPAASRMNDLRRNGAAE